MQAKSAMNQEYSEKEKLKSKWARLEAIVGTEQRVKQIAKDIVAHFEKREQAQENEGGKGDGKEKTTSQLDSELNQLISKAISSNEVVDILESVGLSKPNIAILSDEFLEEVKGMKQMNLAVELLNRLLKGNIKTFSRRNLV